MLLENAVSGFAFGGSDIPGFFGFPSDELYIRFYQVGAFYPFFRAHSTNECQKREPWIQSERVQTAIRASINQRYDLIHYIYTTFERMTRTAEPIMRPMWQEFPALEALYGTSSQYMIGKSILFAPKVNKPSRK